MNINPIRTIAALTLVPCMLAAAPRFQDELRSFPEKGLVVRPAPEHSDATEAVLAEVPAFRERMLKSAQRKDIVKQLSTPEVKAEFAKEMSALFDLQDAAPRIAQLYGEAVAKLDNRYVFDICTTRRVFIYDSLDFTRRLKAGELLPYAAFDQSSGFAVQIWRADIARYINDAMDQPLYFLIPPNTKSVTEFVQKDLANKHRVAIENAIKLENSRLAFELSSQVLRQIIRERKPGLPHWFAEGLAHAGAISMGNMWFGMSDALDGYKYCLGEQDARKVPPTAIDLEKWRGGEFDARTEHAHALASTQVVLQLVKKAKSAGLRAILNNLKADAPVTSEEVCRVARDKAKVDLRAMMPVAKS